MAWSAATGLRCFRNEVVDSTQGQFVFQEVTNDWLGQTDMAQDWAPWLGQTDVRLAAEDFDWDGIADLLVWRSSTGAARLFLSGLSDDNGQVG